MLGIISSLFLLECLPSGEVDYHFACPVFKLGLLEKF